jgi:hypothetical protein
MNLLRDTVARGFKDAAGLKNDPNFVALRQRDEFKKLIERLEKEEPAKPQKNP